MTWVACELCEHCGGDGQAVEVSSDGDATYRDVVDCRPCAGTGRVCQDRDSVDCTGGAPEHATSCDECAANRAVA